MGKLCGFSKTPGVPCGAPAPHQWGSLDLCCSHFDELVTAMFEIKGIVQDRQHQDFVRIYEQRTQRRYSVLQTQAITRFSAWRSRCSRRPG
jgi:hypothetical protein